MSEGVKLTPEAGLAGGIKLTPEAAEFFRQQGAIGGSKKVPKGLATMSKEDRRRVREAGLAARRKKRVERLKGK